MLSAQRTVYPRFRHNVYSENDTIFTDDGKVVVLLRGFALVKSHEADVLRPKLVARYQAGDVLGYPSIDGGLSKEVETWVVAQSDVEVLECASVADFEPVWEMHCTKEKRVLISVLATHPLLTTMMKPFFVLLLRCLSAFGASEVTVCVNNDSPADAKERCRRVGRVRRR